jgi:hypothetical protein
MVSGKRGDGFNPRIYKEACNDYMRIYLNFIISSGSSWPKEKESARVILAYMKRDNS